eukprot:TRINITY_DN1606_c0_g2_i2.p1 TRINITY_DN1606_c0_g2~~TRINITY_DN1606_c0_g2_i2.p1  ORF type:complete len:122 (-),score=20.87 TRINITY_DN1606_c0_g2_i2:436-801(-)
MPAQRRDTKKKVVNTIFYLDLTAPCEDNIFAPDAVETFLRQKIKSDKSASPQISLDKDKKNHIKVVAPAPFSKRYLKYLTKKFLKQQNLRDWIRVVATNKSTYALKYFNIQDEENAETEEK